MSSACKIKNEVPYSWSTKPLKPVKMFFWEDENNDQSAEKIKVIMFL